MPVPVHADHKFTFKPKMPTFYRSELFFYSFPKFAHWMYITLTMKRINYFACATSKIMKESNKNKLSIFKKKNEEKANPLTYF